MLTFDEHLIQRLRAAQRLVVLTGAGTSAESGIPTFRDVLTGLWENFDPQQLATPDAFLADPELVWGWYEWRRGKVLRCRPNPAHQAIAAMQQHVGQLAVVTQNVDDLHERAGSRDVIHLHGSLHEPRCFDCGRSYSYSSDIPDEPEGGRRVAPPRCTDCGGLVRPGVVWFGESLPADQWQRAQQLSSECDVLLSVGTSSVVYPAAQLPHLAKASGATVVQINPDSTGLDGALDFNLSGKAGEVLPELVRAGWHG